MFRSKVKRALCGVIASLCLVGSAVPAFAQAAEGMPIEQTATGFPERYESTSDSGKVRFNCNLEVPGNVEERSIGMATVDGLYCCNRDKAWSMFGEGKEVTEKPEMVVDAGRAPWDYYIFSDDESLSINEGLNYGSRNFGYYSNIGVSNPDTFGDGEVSFISGEECVAKIKEVFEELGYHSEDFIFGFHPLDFQTMKDQEEKCIQEELLRDKDRKESWGQEDDAYFVYAYQKNEGIPVFHEMMSIARIMAYDTPDNAPIRVVYSTRGIEILEIDAIYAFNNGAEQVLLKPFEDIASVLEEKYDYLLNDSYYEVTRAKLYWRVYKNEAQRYDAEPIWYFEVLENGVKKTVALINAATGKEIYLP